MDNTIETTLASSSRGSSLDIANARFDINTEDLTPVKKESAASDTKSTAGSSIDINHDTTRSTKRIPISTSARIHGYSHLLRRNGSVNEQEYIPADISSMPKNGKQDIRYVYFVLFSDILIRSKVN